MRLISLNEIRAWFPDTDDRKAFCLLTIGNTRTWPEFTFAVSDISQLQDSRRTFTLTPAQIAAINPNTKTAPVFRSTADAALTARIYERVPVLLDETKGESGNPWGLSFAALFHMSNDSGLFKTATELRDAGYGREGQDWLGAPGSSGTPRERFVPLYEAKLIHQFDHRWATYDGTDSRDSTPPEKQDPAFEATPRYWVPASEVDDRLASKGWQHKWLMGWRDICRATDSRTLIASAIGSAGVGDKFLLFHVETSAELAAVLLGALNSLVTDFAARQKVSGSSLKYFTFKQLPILPPTAYTPAHLAFLVPRVLELTYTSYAMRPFARDLGYAGEPFPWDEDRRALLRAELDAWYARAYGLSRDDLRYILDPADLLRPDYPSETFRVLKSNELRKHGEYRTQRLVLAAWDRQAAGQPPESEFGREPILLAPQPE